MRDKGYKVDEYGIVLANFKNRGESWLQMSRTC
jgi:hypothetical protein